MASIRQTPTGKFELTLRNKRLLGTRRIFLTFDTEQEAATYGDQVERLFAAGIVPSGLMETTEKPAQLLSVVLRAWIRSGKPAASDVPVLEILVDEIGRTPVDQLTYKWAEKWVQDLKLVANLAPSTIRKRVGSLSRAIDWHLRQYPDAMVGNPLRLLPRGSASYTAQDAKHVEAIGLEAKIDQARDRRLKPGEQESIEAAAAGHKRADRERALVSEDADALLMLFRLIVDSGLRLREAYTLRRRQIRLDRRTINAQSSKQWHGRLKFRDVPIKPQLHAWLTDWLHGQQLQPDDLIFPWWNGDTSEAALRLVTGRLSARFRTLFAYAGCEGLTEHDLRHEATCRWFELRDQASQWLFREAEIDRIMGWAPGSKMGQRYASFRAEDLAARMWAEQSPAPRKSVA